MLLTVSLTLSLFLTLGVSSGVISADAATNQANELWMIEGSANALVRGTKTPIENGSKPYLYMGDSVTAYVPIGPVCSFTGASYSVSGSTVTLTYGSDTATLTLNSTQWTLGGTQQSELLLPTVLDGGGSVMITLLTARTVMSALTGTALKSWLNDDTGTVVFSNSNISYTKKRTSLKEQLGVLNSLLFENPTGDDIYSDIDDNIGISTHPRIFLDQSRFDELRAEYSNSGSEHQNMLLRQVLEAKNFVDTYFRIAPDGGVSWKGGAIPDGMRHPYFLYDENGNRLDGVTKHGGVTCGGSGSGDGYDEGGRLNDSVSVAGNLPTLAFAYQVTGEEKYARAVYLVIKQLGTWAHWGECHSLNVSDTAVSVAIAIDWVWHAFDSQASLRTEMCDILFKFGLLKGDLLIGNSNTEGVSLVCRGDGSHSHYGAGSSNNWQTVCGSGMIISALTLMGDSKYDVYAKRVASTYLKNTRSCLLQYAPDGGYIESPGYWGYGTITYMKTLAALISSAGTDYGYLDTVGLHDSFYFANYLMDTSYRSWNYHDGNVSELRDVSFMYLAASLYGDPNIAYFRDRAIDNAGAEPSLLDAIFYDESLSEGHDGELALDYFNKTIDTVTLRSTWDKNGIFTGLHAGANIVAHGDMDSGNFYLEMGGILWVGDLGTENYNIGSYFSNTHRYKYFAKSVEGHNTVAILNSNSLKYGQVRTTESTDYAKITDFKSLENGGYAVANMQPSYGTVCTSAERGLLYTNSRNTVVIQDEMTFSEATDLAWICALKNVREISDDGKVIYAQSYNAALNKPIILRATLVSDNPDLKFGLSGTSHLLSTTVSATTAADYSFVRFPERAKSSTNRVVIKASGVTEFNVAVVFELIGHEDEVTGYEWLDIAKWDSSGVVSDDWVKEANKDIDYGTGEDAGVKYKYTVTDLVMAMMKIDSAKTLPERMNAIYESFIRTTDIDKENTAVKAKLDELAPYLEEYNGYVRGINAAFKASVVDCVLPRTDE